MWSLSEAFVDDLMDFLVVQCVSDGLLATSVPVVGGSSVAGVDSVKFALDVGHEVIDPFDCVHFGWAMRRERRFVDNPLKEGFDLDIQSSVCVLARNNAVDGGVCKACAIADGLETVLWGIFGVFDESSKLVRSSNHVLASDDSEGRLLGALIDAFRDDWSDEFENFRANSTGDLRKYTSHFMSPYWQG